MDGYDTLRLLDTWELYLTRRGLRPGSVKRYRWALSRFTKAVPDWEHATRDELERFLDSVGGQLRYRAWWVTLLRMFYAWAYDEDLVDKDPARRLQRPRFPQGAARPVSEAQLERVLAAVSGPVRTAIVLMAYGGLRSCEVSVLDWRDVDEVKMRLDGKGGKIRTWLIGPRLRAELDWDSDREGPVIGVHWSPTQTGRRVARAMRRAGVDATAHQLRHRFATEGYARTADLFALQEALGHASAETTRRYVAVSGQALLRLSEAVG